ncbi:MAG: hypothetical protein PHT77_05470 [Bacteroidales bacterium]|nr:hypothetical protein [Bacteroidales bacterium]
MNDRQQFFAGLFAFSCFAVIIGILLVIYPMEYSGFAGLFIIFGFFDMLCAETYSISDYLDERRDFLKREAEKTWIDKALEGGI